MSKNKNKMSNLKIKCLIPPYSPQRLNSIIIESLGVNKSKY